MFGNLGDDTLRGDEGNDSLNGGDGDDRLEGGSGNDTLVGGDGIDRLRGGDGDDVLDPGSSTSFDDVSAGRGNDVILTESLSEDGYLSVGHYDLNGAGIGQIITVNATGDATINKGANGTTVIRDAENAVLFGGMGISGSASDDTFNLEVADEGYLEVTGGDGSDTYNLLATTGMVKLNFPQQRRPGGRTEAAVVDLGSGTVSNDGFGKQRDHHRRG
ncbi:hypothetical protein K3756_18200 (plasmid) [Sulfitobacter sp. S190]|nr:hypothetical protein K3756_18200 [Sulfitobacter sp. S190]